MLLVLALLAVVPSRALAVAVPDAQALMDWAEKAYPAYFPGHPATQTAAPYTYRFYAGSGNYIGVAGSGVWLLGPVIGSSSTPRYMGELADFSCQVDAAACGDKRLLQAAVGGLTRDFIVYLPYKVSGQTNVPVVFALHGTGGDGEHFFGASGWREKADEAGFIVVFPSALTHCFYEDSNEDGQFQPDERQVTSKWAGGRLGQPTLRPLCTADELAALPAAQRAAADHPLADDMAFFRAMAAQLVQGFGADPRRLYVAGFSNGGEMTGRLATEASTTFAAFAVAAAPAPLGGVVAARPPSLVYTVGQFDSEIAPKLGYPAGLPMNGTLVASSVVQASLVQPFLAALQLGIGTSHSQPTVNGVATSQFLYRNALGRAGNAFGLVVIGDLDHAYPNGSNHPLRLADPLWDFFQGQQLPADSLAASRRPADRR
ncbi:hypothetical protein [Aquabacterium sp.]|uniref:hypothetical protein n=1 Tax=Aquabacterium sp. TaxID=1872578 RepID=UPI003784059A